MLRHRMGVFGINTPSLPGGSSESDGSIIIMKPRENIGAWTLSKMIQWGCSLEGVNLKAKLVEIEARCPCNLKHDPMIEAQTLSALSTRICHTTRTSKNHVVFSSPESTCPYEGQGTTKFPIDTFYQGL